MEQFTEEHAKLLLNKEWLAKVDSGKAAPYLLKYHFSPSDLSCFIMVTDTKMVWTEVLNSKILARRWRACNPTSPEHFTKTGDEEAWRERSLELLSKAHTIGGIADLSFEVVDSKYSDLCLELECEAFKWRWEACFLGYRWSSEIISKHLIFPLISLNHLTFSSAEAIGEMPDTDVEKAVDKLGRTARRTIDTHVKNALSKPRVATAIRRMTAMFNFVPDLPPVTSIAEKPHLEVEQVELDEIAPPKLPKGSNEQERGISPEPTLERVTQKRERSPEVKAAEPESATESEDDEPVNSSKTGSRANTAGPSMAVQGAKLHHPPLLDTPPPVSQSQAKPSSDSDSSPQRPVKKIKPTALISSDEDSDDVAKKKEAKGGGIKRGTRQPIKRGGKRF